MNLQHIQNKSERKQGVFVSLCKSGALHFSKGACERFGFKAGQRINVLQDKESLKDWYLSIDENGDNEIKILKSKMHGFYATGIVSKIKESLGIYNDKKLRLSLGKPFEYEGLTLVALITAKV